MKTEVISFNSFMSGEYKQVKPKKNYGKIAKKAITTALPLAVISPKAFAASTAPQAVPVGVGSYLGEKALNGIYHAFDPLIQLLVALSFPVASVIIIGACFLFMFNNADKAWSMIMKAGLGYVLIQLSPMFLNILKEVGAAL
ncbi:hypothetical protein 056SW001B_72 [Bacillus phage 056SW001B]|uniref:Uncharacterized protein n=3 Tax=Gettysburgvirus TaxID=3425034 RepID=A0A7T7ZAR3_9CAUD|nr:hypothetical protein 019DV002_71 [Bacillus phage 019DV002]QFG05298.1 hypothetical protein 019DV004_71 [Bacillus phage 019DV004]QFG05910.1 hypothetical protein 276BB001_72 [Bacillus phage 276BB001]QFG05991.1 hypothetical protein 280BB001_72 [Bacillus phage 280BB001]QFR56536.1 hypothetical protein 056SW001B_72 [Bacillus phage 056SW001B]QQO40419.1 hypothetical protein 268TH004_74 [Bacillus phage 268TH004]QZA70140.1 hypothetical protein 274BB002_72 [Bacillus phage 274BB002]